MSAAVFRARRLHQRRVRLQTWLEGERMQYQVNNHNANYDNDDDYDDADF